MKWPWRKLEDRTAKAIVNLKAILESKIVKAVEVEHAMVMSQMHMFRSSEQIKFNRLDRRIQDLEGCVKDSLKEYHKKLEDQERRAAKDADK